jgi:uncharacterized protein (DUF1501 family)
VLRDGSVTPGQSASFLGKAFDPFFVGGDPNSSSFRLPELSLPATLPLDRLDDRRGLLRMIDRQGELGWNETARGLDSFYDRALTMLASPRVKQAFDLSQEKAALRDAYGRTSYGQSCLLARRLVEAGTKVVEVIWPKVANSDNHSWDHHTDLTSRMRDRSGPMLDQGLSGLLIDLDDRGMLKDTLVVAVGEFGRSPQKGVSTSGNGNSADGRDHWPYCYTAVIAGAGIARGRVHGKSDKTGSAPVENPVHPGELLATIYHAFGIDPATIVYNHLNQPRELVKAEAVTRLFA